MKTTKRFVRTSRLFTLIKRARISLLMLVPRVDGFLWGGAGSYAHKRSSMIRYDVPTKAKTGHGRTKQSTKQNPTKYIFNVSFCLLIFDIILFSRFFILTTGKVLSRDV